MAEVVASILGIATFGLQLSQRLYQFGTVVSGAPTEIDDVARNITNYADTLELLAKRLGDDNEPIQSKEGEKIAIRLYQESKKLFDRIAALLPEPGKQQDASMRQRVSWVFKKSQVQYLASQVECLKSTASLLATVLLAGRRILQFRRAEYHNPSKTTVDGGARADETLSTGIRLKDLDNEAARFKIALIERSEACRKLETIRVIAETDGSVSSSEGDDRFTINHQIHEAADMTSDLTKRPALDEGLLEFGTIIHQREGILQDSSKTFSEFISLWTISTDDEKLQPLDGSDQLRSNPGLDAKPVSAKILRHYQLACQDSRFRQNRAFSGDELYNLKLYKVHAQGCDKCDPIEGKLCEYGLRDVGKVCESFSATYDSRTYSLRGTNSRAIEDLIQALHDESLFRKGTILIT